MMVLLSKLFEKCAPSGDDCRSEMFIECAAEAQAGYLVTGDKAHLLTLKEAAGIPIIAVSVFLRLLGVPENPT
jgi:predicted nucleic acid-binding protein